METAREKLQIVQVLRMEVIYNSANGKCIPRCYGTWLECVNQVLSQNNVCAIDFAKSLRNLLVNGRGKQRNIMIVGPSSCAKTFLLKPLSLMYKSFNNPANEMYAFGRTADAEIIFLYDFRLPMGQGNHYMAKSIEFTGRWTCPHTISKESFHNWCSYHKGHTNFATGKSVTTHETLRRTKWWQHAGMFTNLPAKYLTKTKKTFLHVPSALPKCF